MQDTERAWCSCALVLHSLCRFCHDLLPLFVAAVPSVKSGVHYFHIRSSAGGRGIHVRAHRRGHAIHVHCVGFVCGLDWMVETTPSSPGFQVCSNDLPECVVACAIHVLSYLPVFALSGWTRARGGNIELWIGHHDASHGVGTGARMQVSGRKGRVSRNVSVRLPWIRPV